jgi:hypothetical protein
LPVADAAALMAVALTVPPSQFRPSTVELALTEAMLLVCVAPVWDSQPSVDGAERPELTVEPTLIRVP